MLMAITWILWCQQYGGELANVLDVSEPPNSEQASVYLRFLGVTMMVY
jgi:hypothetical protein